MPVFEFDELADERVIDGKQLLNYWGYNTVCYFAPNTGYTAALEYNREGTELKTMIRTLNANGIEVDPRCRIQSHSPRETSADHAFSFGHG